MKNTLSKITKTALLIGVSLQAGYAAENQKDDLPPGAFVRFSSEETLPSFSLSYEKNMVRQIPEDPDPMIKSLYIEHGDETKCLPLSVIETIRKFPNLEELYVDCTFSKYVGFMPLRTQTKLRTLILSTSHSRNLNTNLDQLEGGTPQLENLVIHSNQLKKRRCGAYF